MARKCFYSFHYEPDNWRASQVRNMGVIEGNVPVSDNDWESVTKGGEPAIKKWIANQLAGKSCNVVLVGQNTAGRKWVTYEISESWNLGKGVVGIRIHNLKDRKEFQSLTGGNPFDYVSFTKDNTQLSSVVKIYNPPYTTSTDVYAYIKNNIAGWVEEAINTRNSRS
jgi:hypothetical protein